jgi:hypothetical protein
MATMQHLFYISISVDLLDNTNGFCFVFNDSENANANAESQLMIERLVQNGMSLNVQETYILIVRKNEVIKLPQNANNIVLFGIEPKQLSLNIKKNINTIMLVNQKQYLYTNDAFEISKDVNKKKLFWEELSKMKL